MVDYPISKEEAIMELINLRDRLDGPFAKEVMDMALTRLEGFPQMDGDNRWISVEENEKPRFRQDCLCLCSYSDTKNHEWDYMMVLSWMGEGENGYVNRPHFQHEGMNGMIVTHWMPLPEPPREAAT